MSTPDRFGVVLGYRKWQLNIHPQHDARHFLYSELSHEGGGKHVATFQWDATAPTKAQCAKCGMPVQFACKCGLYSYHKPRKTRAVNNAGMCQVYGAVLSWGRIVHHETFLRAEYALPIAFLQAPEFTWIPGYHPGHDDTATLKARDRLRQVSQLLHAPVFDTHDALENYAQEEALKW